MRWWATVVAAWLCCLPGALAQSDDWVVLPTATGDQVDWMTPTVEDVGRALRKQGIGVWSAGRAVGRLEEVGPRPPATVSQEQYDAWRKLTSEAVLQLASADYLAARPRLEEAQAFSSAALETLNRDPTRAQAVLDTCLFSVRELLGTKQGVRAARQAQECAALSPGVEPSFLMHPPNVTDLFEQAREIESARQGALLVESEPTGCALYINGKQAGETPAQLTRLFPGKYRVQVECNPDQPAPVHIVDLGAGAQTLFVFDEFDRAVALEPVLHLRYESSPETELLVRHTRQLARILEAPSVLLASKLDSGAIELRRVKGAQMEPSWVRVAGPEADSQGERTELAVAALLAGRCGDYAGAAPVSMDCETGEVILPDAELPRHPPRGQFISGLTLVGVGGASLLSGYGLLVVRKSAGEDWLSDPQSREAQQTWLRYGTGIIATGAAGSAMLVTAMPLVLPYKTKTPWWGWLTGGLGLAVGGAAIALAVTAPSSRAESCKVSGPDPQPCIDRAKRTDLALLLGATAAPLVTIPLVYLLRKSDKRYDAQLVPRVTANSRGAAFGLGGTF